jgi:hypothetical protein
MPAISGEPQMHRHSGIAATPTVIGEEALVLKTSVGFTTTLTSPAQNENIDIRAARNQKAQQDLHSPQAGLGSNRDLYHTRTERPVHPPTCNNNNTATRTTFAPSVQFGDFSSCAI